MKDFNINEAQVAEVKRIKTVSLMIMVVWNKYGKIDSFKVSVLEKLNNLVYDKAPSDEMKAALLKAKENIIFDAI